jgi:hypothetical protein
MLVFPVPRAGRLSPATAFHQVKKPLEKKTISRRDEG